MGFFTLAKAPRLDKVRPMKRAEILGIRNYFPSEVVTNKDLEKIVETSDEWIVERTGIQERRRSQEHETPGFMGAEAAKALIQDLGREASEIDIIIVATITPDYCFPATACVVQDLIGAHNAWGFDLSGACTGYLYALESGRAFIESGLAQNVLIVAAEKMSSILDYEDRTTCVLFGDGGSATWLSPSQTDSGILASKLHLDGAGLPCLYMPAGGSRKPPTEETVRNRQHFVKQEGRSVYKRAVVDMAEVCVELLEREKVSIDEIKLFVPHQANLRIIESAAKRLGLPMEKVALNIGSYGNTTAATIPTALHEAEVEGKLKKGDLVLLAAFGAGFTWGAHLLRY